ncbi:MAG TPA: PHB depolymerase family esterase [Labilithrix sp.]
MAIFAACGSTTTNVVVVPGDDGGSGDDDGGSSGTPPPSNPDGGANPPPDVTTTKGSMSFNGTTRTYVLAVPVDYSMTKSYPLVVDLHGDGGTGSQMQTDWPVESATHRDAIIVYPDGIGRTWDLYDTGSMNPDMPWIKALIDDLATKYSIDKTRVLGSGYSKGAFFVNEMACNYPGVFKAIAVYEGGAPDEEFNAAATKDGQGYWTCPNEQPVAAFVFQGASDGTVTPDSGNFDAMYWAHINGCGDSLSSTTPSPCQQYDGCPAGKRVTYCLVPGLNHVVWYPQGRAAAWSYFTALP